MKMHLRFAPKNQQHEAALGQHLPLIREIFGNINAKLKDSIAQKSVSIANTVANFHWHFVKIFIKTKSVKVASKTYYFMKR